jgi:hypothetical protein
MSLQTRLEALVAAIGADVKALNTAPVAPSSMFANGSGYVVAKDGTAVTDALGAANASATGIITAAQRSITNKHTRARRVDYLVTTAATTAIAGYRIALNHLVRGNAPGVGGFLSRQLWGPATGVVTASNRGFIGVSPNTAAPTDVNPSTLINCVGMGWDSTDINMQIMHNSGVGTATKIDLGADFPVQTVDRTGWYEIDIWCAADENKYNWKVTNIVTGVVVTGDTGVSTNLPAKNVYLSERGWMSAGGTSSVIGIAFGGLYFEHEPV